MKVGLSISPKLFSTSVKVALLGLLLVLVGCDSDDDAQRLSNLVSVANGNYTQVELQGGANVISVGETTMFTVHALTATAEAVSVPVSGAVFSSSNEFATVSSSGVVTGVADGTATITANFGDLIASTPVRVSSAELGSISIAAAGGSELTINECSSIQLEASGLYQGEESQPRIITDKVVWSVVPAANAYFDVSDGLLQSMSAGNLTVTAGLDTVIGTQQVSVQDNLVSIAIEPEVGSGELGVNNPVQYIANASHQDVAGNVDITNNALWRIADEAVVTFADVDKGLVTPSKAGNGFLYANCGGVESQRLPLTSNGGPIQQVVVASLVSPLIRTFTGTEDTIPLSGVGQVDGLDVLEVTEDSDWFVVSNTNTSSLFLSNEDGSKGEVTVKGTGTLVVGFTFTDENNDDKEHTSPNFTIEIQ